MQRLEDAATPLIANRIQYLVGSKDIEIFPREAFSALLGDFLDDLSRELRESATAKEFADIQTFAFWIRKSNYLRLKERLDTKQERIGRGLAFHVAPSNVPINFAYSLAFGMMAGNVNIVRAPSKPFPQVAIVCDCIKRLLKAKYRKLQNQICILKYDADKEITDYFSGMCHARIVWGGDETVREIRNSPLMPRAVEINFCDRYSFAVIEPAAVLQLDPTQLNKLATGFYYDTYLMDQQACSAPHIIFWKKGDGLAAAKERFWQAVYEVARKKYALEGIKVSDKFTELYKRLARHPARSFKKHENYLYIITLDHIHGPLDAYRGKFGLFYEYEFNHYDEFVNLINEKMQTCAYFGIERKEIADLIFKNHLLGIDRIVPIGRTLDIDLIWDGYDVIGSLSRMIG